MKILPKMSGWFCDTSVPSNAKLLAFLGMMTVVVTLVGCSSGEQKPGQKSDQKAAKNEPAVSRSTGEKPANPTAKQFIQLQALPANPADTKPPMVPDTMDTEKTPAAENPSELSKQPEPVKQPEAEKQPDASQKSEIEKQSAEAKKTETEKASGADEQQANGKRQDSQNPLRESATSENSRPEAMKAQESTQTTSDASNSQTKQQADVGSKTQKDDPKGDDSKNDETKMELSLDTLIENAPLERDDSEKGKKPRDLGQPLVDDPARLVRLDPKQLIWVDRKNHHVIMMGEVCRADYPLEFFATYSNRSYEAILSVNVQPSLAHAGLLAVGAKPGRPVQFQPEFIPPSGTEVAIEVRWKDAQGKVKSSPAQDWIRNIETKKALDSNWVFAGSMFSTDERTGKQHYMADSGELICVLNLPTAMLDLPIRSYAALESRLFQAFSERLPPEGTPVTILLKPILTPKPTDSNAPKTDPPKNEVPTPAVSGQPG
jgi:hypothetical protein